ncbi:hypothetical protein [Mesorhizobium japonicum]|uniref:hypothetical protein n=1 Tax=Mesorhizobium japonicum TaxID=2066070 RepID=UPI0005C82C11|nr:hypothetical protein [Mesorhizobium japonicum]
MIAIQSVGIGAGDLYGADNNRIVPFAASAVQIASTARAYAPVAVDNGDSAGAIALYVSVLTVRTERIDRLQKHVGVVSVSSS